MLNAPPSPRAQSPARVIPVSRRLTFASALGLVVSLLGTGLSLAQGLVLCLEADGRMVLEASALGLVCGGSASGERARVSFGATGSGDHCLDCQDVALHLDRVEVQSLPGSPNQGSAHLVLPASGALPSPLSVERLRPVSGVDARPAGVAPRTTVLRI